MDRPSRLRRRRSSRCHQRPVSEEHGTRTGTAQRHRLRASGRYLVVRGEVRTRGLEGTFELQIAAGPPDATLTVYVAGAAVATLCLNELGEGTTTFGPVPSGQLQQGSPTPVVVRYGRRSVVEGTVASPASSN